MESGKVRNKRNRNAKPYDVSQSFIGKLTRAVIPRWISHVIPWKSSESNKNDKGNASTNRNAPDSNFKQPHSRQYTPYNSVVPELSPIPLPTTSGFADSANLFRLPFNKYPRDNPSERVAIDEDNEDEESVSTSGCSSMVPNVDQSENQLEGLQLNESDLERIRDQLPGEIQNSGTPQDSQDQSSSIGDFDPHNGRKVSHWEENINSRHNKPQMYSIGKKPSFNISAFGSPFYENKSRMSLLGESSNESIFYPGKTSYGGASSQRRSLPFASTAPYEARRQLVRVKAKQTHQEFGLVSSTAKRILKSLEDMSTPLSDAQKIPSKSKNLTDSILSFTPSSRRVQQKLKGPPTNKLMTPSPAPIQKNYVVANSGNSSNKMDIQSSIHGKHSVGMTSKPQNQASQSTSSAGGKMKSRPRDSLHYSSKHLQQNTEEELTPQLDLPAVSMDMKGIPKITFGSALTARDHSTPISSSNKEGNKKSIQASSDDNSESSAKLDFTFSSPLMKDAPAKSSQIHTMDDADKKFKFASPTIVSPDRVNHVIDKDKDVLSLSVAAKLTTDQVSTLSKPMKTSNDENGNTPSLMFKVPDVPVSLKRKSSPSKEDANTGFGSKFAPVSGSWECTTCMIRNTPYSNTCAACQTAKPGTSSGSAKQSRQIAEFKYDSAFQPSKDVWECSTCLVQNKTDVANCVACQNPKPGSNKQLSIVSSNENKTNKLSSFVYDQNFKPQKNLWECSSCLVQNSDGSTKCVACGSVKDGGSHNVSQTIAAASEKWICTICFVENNHDGCVCAACGKPRGPVAGFPSKSSEIKAESPVTWECDTCLIRNKSDVTKCIACESTKPGVQISSKDSGAFTFRSSNSSSIKFAASNNNNVISVNRNSSTTEAGFVLKPTTPTNKTSDSSGFFFQPPKPESNNNSTGSDSTGFKFTPTSNASTSSNTTGGFSFMNSDEATAESTSNLATVRDGDDSRSQNSNQLKSTSVSAESDPQPEETKKDTVITSEGFVFGSGNLKAKQESDNPQNAQPVFKFGTNAPTKDKSGTFVFGASVVSSAPSDSNVIKQDSTNSIQTTKPNFAFGSKSSDKVPPGGFSLGASIVPVDSKSPSNSQPIPLSSTFRFGSASQVPSSSSSSAVFGSTISESKPGAAFGRFSFGSSPLSSSAVTPSTSSAIDQIDGPKPAPLVTTFQTPDSSKPAIETSIFPSVPSTAATFSFGQSPAAPTSTSNTTTGLFTFGKPISSDSSSTGSLFNVGPSAATTSSSDIFKFGAGNMKVVPSLSAAPITSSQTLTFGKSASAAGANQSSSIISGTSMLPSGGGFSFTPAPNPQLNIAEKKLPAFGGIAAPSYNVSTANFAFGSSTKTTTTPATSSGIFTFGAQKSNAPLSNISTPSTFTFAAPSATPAPAFGQSQAPSFDFGPSGSTAFGTASAGTNVFGAPGASTGSSTFNVTPSAGSATPFGSMPSVGSSMFGANTSTSTDSNPIFRFGAPAAANPAPSVFSGPQQPSGGFPFTPGTSINANFTSQPAQGFSFSASSGENPNPFSVPQSHVAGRKIRRAARKIKK